MGLAKVLGAPTAPPARPSVLRLGRLLHADAADAGQLDGRAQHVDAEIEREEVELQALLHGDGDTEQTEELVSQLEDLIEANPDSNSLQRAADRLNAAIRTVIRICFKNLYFCLTAIILSLRLTIMCLRQFYCTFVRE